MSLVRSEPVRVKLAPDVLQRFHSVSQSYGMAMPTLAAVAIAQFLINHEASEKQRRAVASSLAVSMTNLLRDELPLILSSTEQSGGGYAVEPCQGGDGSTQAVRGSAAAE